MAHRASKLHTHLLCGTAAIALLMGGAAAAQEARPGTFEIRPQSLTSALNEFAVQSSTPILYSTQVTGGKVTPGVSGATDPEAALNSLLAGSGLSWRREGSTFLVVQEGGGPQGASAGDVDALIVTAQKREEDIQDVPIAISAFTQEDLTRSQIAGGPDLITQVPNMTFTKTNFSSYTIQIRGIGTQAISATTDPAVAVAFNNSSLIRNRFFEQEFYDLERVEVLRGPQGTLYGRNATAGVVNVISRKPVFDYEARLSADVSNYNSSRLEGMINVPLAEDVAALRLAGAWTKRDGYAFNEITGQPIDGRDLWSTRLSLRFAPTDALDVNLIWEHFEEDDDRLRSGKQLCKRHLPSSIGGLPVDYDLADIPGDTNGMLYQEFFSQGCEAASLYSPDSFQAPVGQRLPYHRPLSRLASAINTNIDPYVSTSQSRDLRVIESTVDSTYRAETDTFELQASFDLTDSLTLSSETAYVADEIFSSQDYNRFNTNPGIFIPDSRFVAAGILTPDGYFCDPQIGCANRLVAIDLSTAESRQFNQEFRVSSNFEGPFNFSLGANYTRYDTEDKYYVFINTLTLAAAIRATDWTNAPDYVPGVTDNSECLTFGFLPPNHESSEGVLDCTYVDPNPITSLNDQGHNYFLSKNPYKLMSYAVFGEAYYDLAESLKVTAGLRWTVDKKEAPRIPSWVLASETYGYPVAEIVEQEWREPTGRLTIDWKPDLAFTDETLLYASFARGYKAGGANPPASGNVMYGMRATGSDWELLAAAQNAVAPKTFDPEFVNAFEVGSKNTLLDGSLTLNLAAFYYDYKGYQISQIVSRSAVNMNFDAEVWGLEIEADWRPLENLRLGFKGGYENTRMADGSRAVDTMDRTAGNPDWFVTGPFPSLPNNCILPTYLVTQPGDPLWVLGAAAGGGLGPCEVAYVLGLDPATEQPYQANPPNAPGARYWYAGYPGFNPKIPEINGGAGFYKDLSGNELPNAPDFTATITADYTIPLQNEWLLTLHTDLYYQSEAWTRIFNTEGYDKLQAYTNVNLAAILANEELGWKVMAYVKNVLDRDSITGAFLNSDDTGLTTNVFLTEPRLYGLRVTKDFTGGPWWTGVNPDHTGSFPLTVEIGGQVQRHDAPNQPLRSEAFASLASSLDTLGALQERDLDWGDGRSVKISYRPMGAPWSVAAGVRFGRTNSDTGRTRASYQENIRACASAYYAPYICNPALPAYRPDLSVYPALHWSDTEGRDQEEHTIVEFQVGHDVGLGTVADASAVKLGLRFAEFKSSTELAGNARSGWIVAEDWYFDGIRATQHQTELTAQREFEGAGPILSWDASKALVGNEQAGHMNLDWSLTAGVLFGRRQTRTAGYDFLQPGYGAPFNDQSPPHPRGGGWPIPPEGPPTVYDPDRSRSDDVTVPLLDLSLGLSYEIKRVKVGAGYRWERYFDVLDVGHGEKKDGDRTIDGPYFKIAVGFGG